MTYLPKQIPITNIKELTPNIKVIKIKTNINPDPGQFFEVSILGTGECPLTSCSYNKNYIDFLIKKTGGVTTDLFKLKKGDNLLLRGPYGKGFPIKEFMGKDLILVAGGTGIAPVTSLIEYVEKNRNKFGKIKIFFGFRNKEYVLLKDKIERWKKKFDLTICLDNGEKGWNGETGFVCDIVKLDKQDLEKTIALMCGPEVMMEGTINTIKKQGIKNNQIYLSLERRMECAIGNCGRCLIQDTYVCKDGPVFRYDFIKPKLDNENKANKEK